MYLYTNASKSQGLILNQQIQISPWWKQGTLQCNYFEVLSFKYLLYPLVWILFWFSPVSGNSQMWLWWKRTVWNRRDFSCQRKCWGIAWDEVLSVSLGCCVLQGVMSRKALSHPLLLACSVLCGRMGGAGQSCCWMVIAGSEASVGIWPETLLTYFALEAQKYWGAVPRPAGLLDVERKVSHLGVSWLAGGNGNRGQWIGAGMCVL